MILVKLLCFDIWIFPANTNTSHWILNVLVCKKKLLEQFDSFYQGCPDILHVTADFYYVKYLNTFCKVPDPSSSNVCIPKDLPLQINNCECKVLVCLYCSTICSGENVFADMKTHVHLEYAHKLLLPS